MLACALSLAAIITLLPSVLAQSPAWGQCGGIGWSGPLTCVTGYTCVFENAWISQCIPASKTSSTSSSSPSTPTGGPRYWFSFGDDWTSTAFDSISGAQPTIGNPLGNPPYPGHTPDDKPNWIDAVTTVYNSSTVLTWNFASVGATTLPTGTAPVSSLDLEQQVIEFVNWNGGTSSPSTKAPHWASANTLFSIWIGNNDIPYALTQTGNRTAYLQETLFIQFELVQELYNVGGRNFLWINVAPINRDPQALTLSPADLQTEAALVATYNVLLAQAITGFKANHTGISTYLYDVNTAANAILDSPGVYGFTSGTAYGSVGDFWQTPSLPTSAAQEIFAKDISTILSGTVF